MPDVVAPEQTNPDLADAFRLGGITTPEDASEEEQGPLYRVLGSSKIPIAKSTGSLYKHRLEQGMSARQTAETNWSEAIRYYENDQMGHRKGASTSSPSSATDRAGARASGRLDGTWRETENVVFANAVAMLPLLYSKNPSVEVSTSSPNRQQDFTVCLKHLVNALLNMKEAPGLNIKSKVRRGILMTQLTNTAYLKIGWTKKDDSSEQAIEELQELTQALLDAKSPNEIRVVEGQLQALDEKINFLSPGGPSAKLVSCFRVVVDPTGQEPDHSDCNWMAEWDYLPTPYIKAVYGKPDGEERTVSVYEPTHILLGGTETTSLDENINNFQLFTNEAGGGSVDFGKYGYNSIKSFEAAKYTKVWYIWDKTTRRVYLYADNNWEWPLWVWDDPLKLLRFFPYYRLWFHETPEGAQPKGEVTYYLDQQDAINDINSEISQARSWVRRNLFYDKNKISQEDVSAVLKGPDGTARGVDVPEGQKLTDVIFSMEPPALLHPELFDTAKRFESIKRITGASAAQSGEQFKTNTTNKAVEAYQAAGDTRVDEKIDAIEDWIGDFCWGLAQLCLMYWTKDDVANIIDDEHAQSWVQITDPNEIRKQLNPVRTIGGSTEKPTTKAKKAQALAIGQVLGQFANAVPGAGLIIVRVLEKAFDEIVITDDDWKLLLQTMMAATQKAGAGPGGDAGQPGQGGQQQPPPDVGGDQGHSPPIDPHVAAQVKEQISKLPPQLLSHMQDEIKRGVPPQQALANVTKSLPHPDLQPPPRPAAPAAPTASSTH